MNTFNTVQGNQQNNHNANTIHTTDSGNTIIKTNNDSNNNIIASQILINPIYLTTLSGISSVLDVASQLDENREELLPVSQQMENILLSLERSREGGLIQSKEYNDALACISPFVERIQLATRHQLGRSLHDHTWSKDEIATDLRRINRDVKNTFGIQPPQVPNVLHSQNPVTTSNVAEIMAKYAEMDIRLGIPHGDSWSPDIQSSAESNLKRTTTLKTADPLPLETFQTVGAAAWTSAQVSGLKVELGEYLQPPTGQLSVGPVTLSHLRADAGNHDILAAIKHAGYTIPDGLHEEDRFSITVTDDGSVYDATAPGGLQISRSEPFLWWWNKYTAYHGISPACTPGQTTAELGFDGTSIEAGGVTFCFHATLRVPDWEHDNNLPADMGCFPLFPVSKGSRRLPESIRLRGGFLMPMCEREALWISFHNTRSQHAAVKISVGGVNAITGVDQNTMTPPNIDQDYVVAELQPWLDGIVTEVGVVRQFVATTLGQGYTVEEQVTGKAKNGGFQFDIFPCRAEPPGSFYLNQQESSTLDVQKTPAELNLRSGDSIYFIRQSHNCEISGKNWTLSSYRRRNSSSATLKAFYRCPIIVPFKDDSTYRARSPSLDWDELGCPNFSPAESDDGFSSRGPAILGVSAGGKIQQKIYQDPHSPRVYDEEHGYRFHVHIVSRETWEAITGVLPPISPISRNMYKQQHVPWFTVNDHNIPSLVTSSDTLAKVQSVAQLDKQGHTSLTPSEQIDPDNAPHCPQHPSLISCCVFRPCGHVACSQCLGLALLNGSKCSRCSAVIAQFVGMKQPVPQVISAGESAGSEESLVWNIHETEDLAIAAASTKRVTLIHLPQDRVAALHSKEKMKDMNS